MLIPFKRKKKKQTVRQKKQNEVFLKVQESLDSPARDLYSNIPILVLLVTSSVMWSDMLCCLSVSPFLFHKTDKNCIHFIGCHEDFK